MSTDENYRPLTTGSVMGPDGTGGQQRWLGCNLCGAMVFDREAHDEFHSVLLTIEDWVTYVRGTSAGTPVVQPREIPGTRDPK